VAIYSRSLKSAQSLEVQGVQLYSDDSGLGKTFDDLLKSPDVEAVIIALPILTQPSYIRAALTAGKHVLSEKPIAADVSIARDLLRFYNSLPSPRPTWSVAESERFSNSLAFAAKEAKSLGRLLGFQVRIHKFTSQDGRYFQTAWRKKPGYQGGFLLDGGVHYISALRMLIAPDDIKRVSAFSAQLQEHLPPVDTVTAVVKTKLGVSGNFSVSFGTSWREEKYLVAYENGTIEISWEDVTIQRGKETIKEVRQSDKVGDEVACWTKGVKENKIDARQSANEALLDLEILEAMLKSGEQNGLPIDIGSSK